MIAERLPDADALVTFASICKLTRMAVAIGTAGWVLRRGLPASDAVILAARTGRHEVVRSVAGSLQEKVPGLWLGQAVINAASLGYGASVVRWATDTRPWLVKMIASDLTIAGARGGCVLSVATGLAALQSNHERLEVAKVVINGGQSFTEGSFMLIEQFVQAFVSEGDTAVWVKLLAIAILAHAPEIVQWILSTSPNLERPVLQAARESASRQVQMLLQRKNAMTSVEAKRHNASIRAYDASAEHIAMKATIQRANRVMEALTH